jgi:hypothetical protein
MKRAALSCAVLSGLFLLATGLRAQSGFTGSWVTHSYGTVVIDLQVNGAQVSGTVSRTTDVSSIYDATVTGSTITFKANSLDGHRVTTFTGTLQGDQIVFVRSVQLRPGGNDIGPGIFGSQAAPEFVATREATGLPVPRALLGNWRLNLQRSRYDPGPAPRPMVPDVASFIGRPGGSFELALVSVGPEGARGHTIAILKADEREHPHYLNGTLAAFLSEGVRPPQTISVRAVSERIYEMVFRTNGTVTTRRRFTVDGNTLTEVATVVNAQGQTTQTNTLVWERIAPTTRPPTN